MRKFTNFLLYPITLFLKPFYIAPVIIAAGIVAGASIATNVMNYFSNKKTNKENQANQSAVNDANLKFATEQLNEQKYLNRTQYQLQASDMQKAGINPAMAGNMSTLQAGSYQSNQQSIPLNPYSFDSSAINTIADLYMQHESLKAQESMNKANNATQIKVAEINERASKYSVDKSAESQERIASNHEFAETLRSDSRNATQSSIANLNATVSTNNNMANNQIKAALDNANREIQMTIEYMRQDSNNARKLADVFMQKYNTDSYFKMNADNLEYQYRKMKQDMTIESQRQFYEAYNMTMQHLDNLGRDALTLFLFGKGR